jgi:hypothetical protein
MGRYAYPTTMEVAHMCYERRASRQRAEQQEESRRFWDVFNRETTVEPPPERPEPEVRLEGEDAEVGERAPAER